jgi:hypothetical protein
VVITNHWDWDFPQPSEPLCRADVIEPQRFVPIRLSEAIKRMEWLIDDPNRGGAALMVIAIVLASIALWLGRKKIVVTGAAVLVFLLLAAIAIPSAIPVRTAAQRAACVNNLKAIQEAKTEWARANNRLTTDIPAESDLFGTNRFLLHRPACPRNGIYRLGAVGQHSTCTLSNKGHRL